MIKTCYKEPSQEYYLVVKIEEVEDLEFKNLRWDFKKLKNYLSYNASAFPFTATLTELMRNKVK